MAKLLILGTYHFANPGVDAVQTQVADVLSEEKQQRWGKFYMSTTSPSGLLRIINGIWSLRPLAQEIITLGQRCWRAGITVTFVSLPICAEGWRQATGFC